MNFREVLKGLLAAIFGSLLILVVLALVYSLVFSLILAKPDKVKSIVKDSGIYQKIPEVTYDNAIKSASEQNSNVPLEDPEVKKIALSAFNASFAQKNIEAAIDGTYGWLEGKTDQPEFKFDFASAQKEFADDAANYAEKRAKKLPPCSYSQLSQIRSEADLFTLDCSPPGFSIAALKQNLRDKILASETLKENVSLAPKDLNNQTKQASDTPKFFQAAKKAVFLLVLLVVLLVLAIIYLSPDKTLGLKRINKLFLVAGVLIVLAAVFASFVINKLLNNTLKDPVANDLVVPLVQEFNQAIAPIYYSAGIIVLLLALGSFLLARKLKVN